MMTNRGRRPTTATMMIMIVGNRHIQNHVQQEVLLIIEDLL